MAEHTPERALESVCEQLAKQAKRVEAAIKRKKTRAAALRAEIDRLQHENPPDKDRIKQLQGLLVELQDEIAEDEAALRELQAHIAENCH